LNKKIPNALFLFLMTTNQDSFLLQPKMLASNMLRQRMSAKSRLIVLRVATVEFPALGGQFSLLTKLVALLSPALISSLLREPSHLRLVRWSSKSILKSLNMRYQKVRPLRTAMRYLECKFSMLTLQLLKFPKRILASSKL